MVFEVEVAVVEFEFDFLGLGLVGGGDSITEDCRRRRDY